MTKITKQQEKLHLESMELINSDKPLTQDEKWFIVKNYSPNATNLTTGTGTFFTPESIGFEFASFSDPQGDIVELCAGIGSLSFYIIERDQYSGHRPAGWVSPEIKNLVCLEINPEYVTVGKRLIPEAEWITGSVFNETLIRSINRCDCVISNPPFGSILSNDSRDWIKFNKKSCFDLSVVAVALELSDSGCFILPKGRTYYDVEKHEKINNPLHDEFKEKTGFMLTPSSWDLEEFRNDWTYAKPSVEFVSVDKA